MKYWFKRRRYGFGWIPVTWQGWSVVISYLVVILGGATMLENAPEESASSEAAFYLMFVVIATIALFSFGYKYGPKPKWRWGKKPGDNPEEDW